MTENFEVWRDVPGYGGRYQASTMGQIRSIIQRIVHVMKPKSHEDGYVLVKMTMLDKQRMVLVHRLVMLTFVGVCPEGYQVNHINGVKHDNRVENLEYVTRQENMRHYHNVLKKRNSFPTISRKL